MNSMSDKQFSIFSSFKITENVTFTNTINSLNEMQTHESHYSSVIDTLNGLCVKKKEGLTVSSAVIVFYLQLLQQNLETNFYSGPVSWDEVSPNDAAALLKKFIRELPAPLLTSEYLNTFSAVRGQCATFDISLNPSLLRPRCIMNRAVIRRYVRMQTGDIFEVILLCLRFLIWQIGYLL